LLQTLSTIRRHVRERVRNQAYAELDRTYTELAAQWRVADATQLSRCGDVHPGPTCASGPA